MFYFTIALLQKKIVFNLTSFFFTPWVSDINIVSLEIYTKLQIACGNLFTSDFPPNLPKGYSSLFPFVPWRVFQIIKVTFFLLSLFWSFFRRRVATSFEGKYGRIRYWLKAEIDKPWGFNSKTKRAFTVIDHIDINTSSLLVRWAL